MEVLNSRNNNFEQVLSRSCKLDGQGENHESVTQNNVYFISTSNFG